MADAALAIPLVGDVWTVRVFRDPSLQMRVFRLVRFMNLCIGVVDEDDIEHPGKILYFGKIDLQFLDLISRQEMKELPRGGEKGSQEHTDRQSTTPERGNRGPDQAPGRDRRSSNDAGVREERDGQDRLRR